MSKIQCSKPCYDCPFRKDIVPYQSLLDVEENIKVVCDTRPVVHAACHHDAKLLATLDGTRDVDESQRRAVTCAGFLIMRQKLGLSLPAHCHPIPDVPYVYDKLSEFMQQAASRCQQPYPRAMTWLLNQPRHKQLRWIKKLEFDLDLADREKGRAKNDQGHQ